MALMDLILNRRSIRKYTVEDIPEDKLDKILQAGLLAPTGRNQKPCEFYLIRDRKTLEKLTTAKSAGGTMLARSNAAIAVFGDSGKTDTWVEDCSIAMTHMMLMAEELGIGCCWVQIHLRMDDSGKDAEANVREILDVPELYRIAGILSLGMVEEHPQPYKPEDADRSRIHRV